MLALAIEFTGVPGARILRYSGRSRTAGDAVSVAMAEGKHPVPFRTRKLSLPAPMVLPRRRGGRVGRRRDILNEGPLGGPSSFPGKVPAMPAERSRGKPTRATGRQGQRTGG